MLDFKDVTFQYEGEPEPIIDHLSFHVDPGEFVSVIGTSGCGKSTIFRLINRFLEVESGCIQVDGAVISGHSSKQYAGYMPQKDLLFPWRTILDNLTLPMEIQGVPATDRTRRATAMLSEIGLESYENKYPQDLSGGMRQRVSFARTLLTESDLMLLDEPFSALDALTRIDMQEWILAEWEKHHRTILFITHDVEEALFLSNRILIVEETPIKRLKSIEVPMNYPRKREYLKQPDLIDLKETLVDQLRKQVIL